MRRGAACVEIPRLQGKYGGNGTLVYRKSASPSTRSMIHTSSDSGVHIRTFVDRMNAKHPDRVVGYFDFAGVSRTAFPSEYESSPRSETLPGIGVVCPGSSP